MLMEDLYNSDLQFLPDCVGVEGTDHDDDGKDDSNDVDKDGYINANPSDKMCSISRR